MLREAFEYLTTPCGRTARRFGYLGEAVALGARHRRQRRAWAPHVAACRNFMEEAMERAAGGNRGGERGGRALVAGSGLLIELPLEAMAARFAEVVLADVVHARSARRRAARFPNVRLVELDVTGTLEPLARFLTGQAATRTSAPAALPRPEPPPPPGGRFAFAVSCNLLSQLPLMPLEAVEARAPAVTEAERAAFAQSLARTHLEWLAEAADRAALFTDTESVWLEKGRPVERDDSLWGLAMPPPDRAWRWDIAPAPEADRRRDLIHEVGGWFDVAGLIPPG
ncbi:hypothetical protein [Azospirillum sp. SYSU D00513]|uniref:hypothetical protein n=1 Tax=Azospirillum sp. SYSU D00513 TaxID=2812561 RepID=UPI001A95748A|nr:hypothetical protein [Azospirillum sp. SYSU D00513]